MRNWSACFTLLLWLLASIPSCVARNDGRAHSADPYQPVAYVKINHPEWSKNAAIYQINTRQFTQEGTFRVAEKELPRLKDLGVQII